MAYARRRPRRDTIAGDAPTATIGTILREQSPPPERTYRIALVAPFPPPFGGMGNRFERLADILEGRGHNCQRLRVEWFGTENPFRLYLRASSFLMAAVGSVRTRPDVVHCVTGSIRNAFAMGSVLAVAKATRHPTVLSIGGGTWDEFARCAPRWQRAAVSSSLRIADRVVICTEDLRSPIEGLRVAAARIVYLSNALPDEAGSRIDSPPPEEFVRFADWHSPVLLYVGGLHENYGLLDAVAALEELRNGLWPQAGLAAFVKKGGNASYERRVNSLVSRRGLQDRVAIHQSVPWLVAAMPQADVMLRCTRTSEGDSRAVREALAMGLRVVASDIGHRPALVRTYAAGDVDDLVRVLGETLASEKAEVCYEDDEGEANIVRCEGIYAEVVRSGGCRSAGSPRRRGRQPRTGPSR